MTSAEHDRRAGSPAGRDPYTDKDPEARDLVRKANGWLGRARDAGVDEQQPPDETALDWERMAGSERSDDIDYGLGEELEGMTEAQFYELSDQPAVESAPSPTWGGWGWRENLEDGPTARPFQGRRGRRRSSSRAAEYISGRVTESVTSERPPAVRRLEEESSYLIEQLRAVVRNGETPGADLAADAALNAALYQIRSRRPRTALAALAEALGCTRQTVSRRVRRGAA